jgi:heme O synthase-like polyprenyltransferase
MKIGFICLNLALVVATTMMGLAMTPVPFDAYTFILTTLGTTLTSSSANSINQVIFLVKNFYFS